MTSRPSTLGSTGTGGAPGQEVTVRARVPLTLGRAGRTPAELVTFRGLPDDGEHLACLLPGGSHGTASGSSSGGSTGSSTLSRVPLVRLHSECLTGDVFGSAHCDCGKQLDESLRRIAEEGGAVLYLRQEGRGIGLYNKLDAYLLQDGRTDTFEANRLLGRGPDEREYATAAAMLFTLGLHRIRLLTNNPDKVRQLRAHGIDVAESVPTGVHLTEENAAYLTAKADRGGHSLALPAEVSK